MVKSVRLPEDVGSSFTERLAEVWPVLGIVLLLLLLFWYASKKAKPRVRVQLRWEVQVENRIIDSFPGTREGLQQAHTRARKIAQEGL